MEKSFDVLPAVDVESAGVSHPKCTFRNGGAATQSYCSSLTVSPIRNRSCCAANCASPWRACRACINQGGGIPPDFVVDHSTGLCQWHAEKGVAEPRPKVTARAVEFRNASMVTASSSVVPRAQQKQPTKTIKAELPAPAPATVAKPLVVAKSTPPVVARVERVPSVSITRPVKPKKARLSHDQKLQAFAQASVALGGKAGTLRALVDKTVEVLKKRDIPVNGDSLYAYASTHLSDGQRKVLLGTDP